MTVFDSIFFALVVLALLFVTIRGRDFYPFSSYPMFSWAHQLDKVQVYRIALEDEDGRITWWRHEAHRYPEFVGRALAKYDTAITNSNPQNAAFATLNKQKLLLEVRRLIGQAD